MIKKIIHNDLVDIVSTKVIPELQEYMEINRSMVAKGIKYKNIPFEVYIKYENNRKGEE